MKLIHLSVLSPVKKMYWSNGISEVLFFTLVAWWLGVVNRDVLYMTQELSLFLPTRLFFLRALQEPAGMLGYGAEFLTQFFYYPWVGVGIFILLSVLFQWLLIRCFRLPLAFWGLTFILLAALVAGGTALGYVIYYTVHPEVLFSQLLALLGCMGLCYGFLTIPVCKWLYFGISVLVGYPLIGAWGLIAGLLCLFFNISGKGKIVLTYWWKILGVVWIGIVPWLYHAIVYFRTPAHVLYTVGLPSFSLQGHIVVSYSVWIMLGVALILLTGFRNRWKTGKYFLGLPFVVLLLGGMMVLGMSCNDKNFRTEIAMYRVMDRRNWKEMPALYRNAGTEPSRFMVLAKNLGFYRLGVAGQRMFSMPDGTRQAAAPFQVGLEQMGGEWFYYHYGLVNYAYRWGMEKMVKWGIRTHELKLMAKCALLNGENTLATKYLKTLEKTFFHRPWANYYLSFAEGRRKLEEDLEFRSILPLCRAKNVLDNDRRNIEVYLLDQLSFLDNGTPESTEVSLLANMTEKNKLKTLMRFSAYAATHATIPVHYQEAALLFAFLTKKDISEIERFDLELLRRFQAFIGLWKQRGEQVKSADEPLFRKDFAGTYWYYYLFGPELRRKVAGDPDRMNSPH